MEGPVSTPHHGPTTRELAAAITQLAGHLNAANRRWPALIAEFDRRKGWSDRATQCWAHWLNWQCGLDLRAARIKERAKANPQSSAVRSEAAAALGREMNSPPGGNTSEPASFSYRPDAVHMQKENGRWKRLARQETPGWIHASGGTIDHATCHKAYGKHTRLGIVPD